MKYLRFVHFLENSLPQTTVFLSIKWSYEPYTLALQKKVETDHYYNLVMEVDLDSRANKLIKKRIFKDRYLCMRMRMDGNPGVGFETERMHWSHHTNWEAAHAGRLRPRQFY